MIRIVAPQPNLDWNTRLHAKLGRREAETLNVMSTTCTSWLRVVRAVLTDPETTPIKANNKERRVNKCCHQNHHPRPMLNEFGALIVVLVLLTAE